MSATRRQGAFLGLPLGERRSLPGPAPAGGPISCTDKKWGKETAGGLKRPAWAAPGARYARRPISGLRAAFGGWPPKRGLRTAVAGAPPRAPGLSPLRGPGPAGRILYKDGLRPNPFDPRAASGWPAAKVGGARFTDERTSLQHPASRRAAGAMPLPESLRNRTGSASGETRIAHHAHVRSAAHGRRSFLAALLFLCWEHPQPELSPQLVYS